MYNTSKPDLDNGSPVDDEVDDYWENSLSEKDKEIWSLYSSMEFRYKKKRLVSPNFFFILFLFPTSNILLYV
jgi:hypothetical protein